MITVLDVGGLQKMAPHYRQLAEKSGGRFIHLLPDLTGSRLADWQTFALTRCRPAPLLMQQFLNLSQVQRKVTRVVHDHVKQGDALAQRRDPDIAERRPVDLADDVGQVPIAEFPVLDQQEVLDEVNGRMIASRV